jgi:transposase
MMRRRSDLPLADPQPWSSLVPTDSFYARLAKWRDVLVDDEDYASLYKDSPKGRPSIPPSMVVLAMLLQYHDDCSDAGAEARMRFDLRWKHALGLALEDGGFDATVLCHFRRKLLERGLERNLFERLVNAAREAGLITKDATQILHSSHVLGAAGATDTYTLIRGGIRKLLRALGYTAAGEGKLTERLWWYLDPQRPEKPDIDWSEAEVRAAHLKEIVQDSKDVLSSVDRTGASPAVSEASVLLEKIVGDDVEQGPPPSPGPKRRGRPPNHKQHNAQGARRQTSAEDPGPRLRQAVPKDRILSVVDPKLRVGHKSQRRSWAGYKFHVAEEPQSELITQLKVRPANEYDADAAPDLVGGQRESVGPVPKELLCDGAYGSADVRARLRGMGVEVVAKMRPLTDSKHLRKDEFEIDLFANDGKRSLRCPAGVTTTDFRMARDGWYRPVKLFRFPRETGDGCELRERCLERCLGGPAGRTERPVRQPPGRQVQLHYREEEIQKARRSQRTPEQKRALREKLKPRAKVERKIAELVRPHGLRQGRYFGEEKTDLQAVFATTMVNAKRLFTLSVEDAELAEGLREALAA